MYQKGRTMKNLIFALYFLLMTSYSVMAQLKSQAERQPLNVKTGITSFMPGSLFSFLSSDRFSMSHSYSMMYYTGGGYNGSLGVLTNTMNFRLADPLLLKVNMGVQHQPFGGPKALNTTQFLHGAELIYKPNNNLIFNIGYSNNPYYSGVGSYENPFVSPWAPNYGDYQFGGTK